MLLLLPLTTFVILSEVSQFLQAFRGVVAAWWTDFFQPPISGSGPDANGPNLFLGEDIIGIGMMVGGRDIGGSSSGGSVSNGIGIGSSSASGSDSSGSGDSGGSDGSSSDDLYHLGSSIVCDENASAGLSNNIDDSTAAGTHQAATGAIVGIIAAEDPSVPSSASFSPTINMYGIFFISASRIFLKIEGG